jgi:hypothetical protein
MKPRATAARRGRGPGRPSVQHCVFFRGRETSHKEKATDAQAKLAGTCRAGMKLLFPQSHLPQAGPGRTLGPGYVLSPQSVLPVYWRQSVALTKGRAALCALGGVLYLLSFLLRNIPVLPSHPRPWQGSFSSRLSCCLTDEVSLVAQHPDDAGAHPGLTAQPLSPGSFLCLHCFPSCWPQGRQSSQEKHKTVW